MGRNINKRNFLQGAGAMAGAALGGVGNNWISNEHLEFDGRSVEANQTEPLARINQIKQSNFGSAEFYANAAGRHEQVENYAQEFNPQNIPRGVWSEVADLFPGVVAQESRYDPRRINSSSGARGAFQVMPNTYNGEVERLPSVFVDFTEMPLADFSTNFNAQLQFACLYIDRVIYPVLERAGIDTYAQHYGVRGLQKDKFIALCIFNAYKAGPTRMRQVLDYFSQNFESYELANPDGTALGLFNYLSAQAEGNVNRYGVQSREYMLRCLAGAESLNDHFGTRYGINESHIVSPVGRIVDETKDSLAGVAAGALVGHSLVKAKVNPVLTGKNKKAYGKDVLASMATTPVGLVRNVSNRIVKLVEPKGKTKVRLESANRDAQKRKPKTSRAKKSRTMPKVTRRQALATLGLGTFGVGYIFKDRLLDLLPNILENGAEDLDDKILRSEVRAELRRLNDRGIFLSSSWESHSGQEENGEIDECGRTTLTGMRELVLDTVVQLLDDLEVLDPSATHEHDEGAIVFTGGAESCGHSDRTHGHGNGYAVDLRRSSSDRVEQALIDQTTVTNRFTRQLHPEHKLVQSGLVLGDKIFRFNSKYFLFGVQNQGQVFVCYFDAESSHRHIEMIPWEDYNVDSQNEFAREAELRGTMRGIWRIPVRDHIRANL